MYTFIIFAVCTAADLEMGSSNACVCALGYYQTASGSDTEPPTCQACPDGSTTTATDSQAISDCGKNETIIIPID